MINNYYQLYIEDVFNLANTLSVKFEQAAEAINNKVIMDNGYSSVDMEDPYSWKYYQNISGSYHFTNSTLEVTSLDTLDVIVFSKENLLNHPATKQAYSYGSIYYYNLINKYPDDEMLIKGILYPCDIHSAVAAKDGTILSYPAHLVDSNELNFIYNLQDWIYDYLIRWVNKQYTVSHDLYVPMYMAQFYIHLIPAIINLRLQACKTPEAHSFHVRQYLASHGMLDVYLSVLTKEQALFLYRNINYIEANAGKQEVFDWLVDNVMTKRGLPLYEYNIKHDVSRMIATEDNDYASSERPTVIFRRLPINYPTVDPRRNIYSTQEMLLRINDQAIGNLAYHEDNGVAVENALTDAPSDTILTKFLESSITDYSQSAPYPLADTLLNEWLSMSTSNRYTAYVTIEFPITKETSTLPVKEAFILFTYCFLRATGIVQQTLPKVIASRVYKATPPTLNWMINYFSGSSLSDVQLASVFDNAPPTTSVNSINSFYQRAYSIFKLNLQHYYAESKLENYFTTGELKVANTQLFEDRLIQLDSGSTLYADWLKSYSYDFSEYSDKDFLDLSVIIYEQATGSEINKQLTVKDIQRSMVSLFTKLVSYSVQVISNADSSPVFLVPNPGVKLGDIFDITYQTDNVEVPNVTVIDNKGIEMDNAFADMNVIYPTGIVSSSEKDDKYIDYTTECVWTAVSDEHSFQRAELSPIKVTGADYEQEYDSLTLAQKQELFEISL
jgi:hypothetical protein